MSRSSEQAYLACLGSCSRFITSSMPSCRHKSMRSRPNLPLGIKRTQAVGALLGSRHWPQSAQRCEASKHPPPENFRSGQQFEAWIGLVPKDHSTAGKVRLGVITRAGDESLHSVPVAGAMADIRHLPSAGSQSVLSAGLGQLLKHKPPKPAVMVPANRAIAGAGKVPSAARNIG